MNAYSVLMFQFVFSALIGVALSSFGIVFAIKFTGWGRFVAAVAAFCGFAVMYHAAGGLLNYFGGCG